MRKSFAEQLLGTIPSNYLRILEEEEIEFHLFGIYFGNCHTDREKDLINWIELLANNVFHNSNLQITSVVNVYRKHFKDEELLNMALYS